MPPDPESLPRTPTRKMVTFHFRRFLWEHKKKNLWSMGVVAQKVGGVSWLFFVSGESKFVAFSLLKVV